MLEVEEAIEQEATKTCINVMLGTAKAKATKEGIAFTLRASDIELPEYCPALGTKLSPHAINWGEGSMIIERIDKNKGYIRGNIYIISFKAWAIKQAGSIEELERTAQFFKRMQPTPGRKKLIG